jgi:hypothetical protein
MQIAVFRSSAHMVMVLWFYGVWFKHMENHGEMVPSMCLPIKLPSNHVPHRKSVAFAASSGVNLVGISGEEI